MSTNRRNVLLKRITSGAVTVVLAAGVFVGPASAAGIEGSSKASPGSIFSCKKHHYPWC